MKITHLALSAIFCALVALPASAGKPDRDPSEKNCINMALYTACSPELDTAIGTIEGLISNNEDVATFLSRNPEQDAGTLICKLTGAEIKLDQDKTGEAIALVEDALAKIDLLYERGKLDPTGRDYMVSDIQAALDCLNGL